jgi:hypothetical protein
MSPPTPVSQREEDLAAKPGPANEQVDAADGGPHRGAVLTGEDGADGRKAFYIHVEARPGMEEQVVAMLGDIFRCVLDEPATGPGPPFGIPPPRSASSRLSRICPVETRM